MTQICAPCQQTWPVLLLRESVVVQAVLMAIVKWVQIVKGKVVEQYKRLKENNNKQYFCLHNLRNLLRKTHLHGCVFMLGEGC